MAKSQETFSKKEKEKKRRKKRQEKLERKIHRRQAKQERGSKTFEEMIQYVDEDGNLTDTPPDPKKKKKFKLEDIQIGVPTRIDEPTERIRTGKVKFFNDEKGYGFIVDEANKESIFVHINNVSFPIAQDNRVNFEIEMGPKGPNAINVVEYVDRPKPKPEPEATAEAEVEAKEDAPIEETEVKDTPSDDAPE